MPSLEELYVVDSSLALVVISYLPGQWVSLHCILHEFLPTVLYIRALKWRKRRSACRPGRDAEAGLEAVGEVAMVGEADERGNLADGQVAGQEEVSGSLEQILQSAAKRFDQLGAG